MVIEIEVSPSLPEIAHQIEVPVALVMDEELIFYLPPVLSSHIVAQLEAQQQLEALQETPWTAWLPVTHLSPPIDFNRDSGRFV
jgi:hypothetical protein